VDQQTGKYIIGIGAIIVVAGLLVYFFHDKLHWLGRLPGDIRVERENFRFYFPLTTMILLSLLLTLLSISSGNFFKVKQYTKFL
jgi:H+/Cl- antiporter ClcA